MACLVWHGRQDADGHSSGGLDRPRDRALRLEEGQTWVSLAEARSLGVPLRRYHRDSIERELEV
jgi:hypothetical protein